MKPTLSGLDPVPLNEGALAALHASAWLKDSSPGQWTRWFVGGAHLAARVIAVTDGTYAWEAWCAAPIRALHDYSCGAGFRRPIDAMVEADAWLRGRGVHLEYLQMRP